MRKRIVTNAQQITTSTEDEWLKLEDIAEVEITSETIDHPIESALLPGGTTGWRAASPGKQTIRLLFAQPQPLRRIKIHFSETSTDRTQEFILRWSPDSGQTFNEIVRQQWNFSSPNATSEEENYLVDISAATVLELIIVPNISGGNAIASLSQLRLA